MAEAKVGQPAPSFDMPSTKNIEKLNENVQLDDYKGETLKALKALYILFFLIKLKTLEAI